MPVVALVDLNGELTMEWVTVQKILSDIQHAISCIGVLIIFSGILFALIQYLYYSFTIQLLNKGAKINKVRLNLGQVLLLGLEFIVAADLIGTTTAPDYYSVGILAIIVTIRTLLSYSLTREMKSIKDNPEEIQTVN